MCGNLCHSQCKYIQSSRLPQTSLHWCGFYSRGVSKKSSNIWLTPILLRLKNTRAKETPLKLKPFIIVVSLHCSDYKILGT